MRCQFHGSVGVGQGRGGSTGYENAVALPGRGDQDELAKENAKSTKPLKGQIVFSVAKVGVHMSLLSGCRLTVKTRERQVS